MSDTVVCSYADCKNNIEFMCQVCKLSYCKEHAQKTQYRTKSGKLQYATLCLNDVDKGFNDELVQNKFASRLFIQLAAFAVIIIVILLILRAIFG